MVSSRTIRLASAFPLKSPRMSDLAHQVTLDVLTREAPPTFQVKRRDEMMWDNVILNRNGNAPECLLYGLIEHLHTCFAICGRFTTAQLTNKRAILREPWWTPLSPVLSKKRMSLSFFIPAPPPSLTVKSRFSVLGNVYHEDFRKLIWPRPFWQYCDGIWQTLHKQSLHSH